jgi:uncharacterized membrane protein
VNWLGLIDQKPVTEDYVPVLPWLGVMWWGVAAAQWALARGWLQGGAGAVIARGAALPGLVWVGRWSLSWYMVHQPLLIGLLIALRAAGAGR